MDNRLLYLCARCSYVSVTGLWVENVICPSCHADLGHAQAIADSPQLVEYVDGLPKTDHRESKPEGDVS
jgi:hypothetical protein